MDNDLIQTNIRATHDPIMNNPPKGIVLDRIPFLPLIAIQYKGATNNKLPPINPPSAILKAILLAAIKLQHTIPRSKKYINDGRTIGKMI